ncbi:hypothetical protein [Sediminibacterium soli]|uniref:hypothetical protein n=1 Tax=Sediminibacterium soli TaxID=2698829 RepID=UPI00137A2D75|nr:hypothetical protein [Sediminibacterium soli]NCI47084.1 hypothetical protein [Sediminibacterium soli]
MQVLLRFNYVFRRCQAPRKNGKPGAGPAAILTETRNSQKMLKKIAPFSIISGMMFAFGEAGIKNNRYEKDNRDRDAAFCSRRGNE